MAKPQTVQRNLACINRAPLQALPRQLQAALQQLPHRVLLRATPSTTCAARVPWSAPTASIISPPPPPPLPWFCQLHNKTSKQA
jgi:hypothetical protein